MQHISMPELLELFDESVHQAILDAADRYDATYIVVFENHNFDSSAFGARTAMTVGPNNTYKSPAECEGKWLNDLPSQRQYPTAYAHVMDWPEDADDVLAEQERNYNRMVAESLRERR
jgi:hypothetical protein